MNKSSREQIHSDLDEIEKLSKGTLEEKSIKEHLENIRYELKRGD